ncbi:MAG TPA: aminomethyl-transferring glycine dehydrogenase subunit GcvPB [Candidatus Limnocylindrales bacterium]|nr:aminomethyl-transferring glycine dehydrogenase subunit GcvPB [Candidatus Limnocylindrales bacterium]
MTEPLLFELGRLDHPGPQLPAAGVPVRPLETLVPRPLQRRTPLPIPTLSEIEVARHFGRLGGLNYNLHTGIYPLGSCTMKFNPTVNEAIARMDDFAELHPYHPEAMAQGALRLLWELEQALRAITGMSRMSLQPAAGAHGEWTGLRIIQAYHHSRGETRDQVIVPDSSHGTNPASAALSRLQTITVRSGSDGMVHLDDFREKLSSRTAAVMLTNPNTCGLFEKDILAIAEMAHAVGAQLYYDGANLNALVGIARPGDMGFDVVHLNLHKTFSTPHGGGGPGAGPVGVQAHLVPFLPIPMVERRGDRYAFDYDRPQSIGKVRSFYGNFGMLVRAYAYIRTYGNSIHEVAENAVLNASYLRHHLRRYLDDAFEGPSLHEFVMSARRAKAQGVRALDIAKRLIDLGYHPPTIYFPLIVAEALMIEPTETESKASLDAFIEAFDQIAKEIVEDPDLLRGAPHNAPVGRLDEVRAARHPDLRWRPPAIRPPAPAEVAMSAG